MRCLRQRSYRCGCPDGNRHAHVVHCHARTSHNRRCPYRHPWKVPAVYCSCGSSIRLSVILKGRPVSSEPSQPQPRARKSLLSVDAFMLWRVPGHNVSPQSGGVVYQIQVSARAAGIIPDRAGTGAVIILNINGRMASSTIYPAVTDIPATSVLIRSPSRRTNP